jgi:hypothetical protein
MPRHSSRTRSASHLRSPSLRARAKLAAGGRRLARPTVRALLRRDTSNAVHHGAVTSAGGTVTSPRRPVLGARRPRPEPSRLDNRWAGMTFRHSFGSPVGRFPQQVWTRKVPASREGGRSDRVVRWTFRVRDRCGEPAWSPRRGGLGSPSPFLFLVLESSCLRQAFPTAKVLRRSTPVPPRRPRPGRCRPRHGASAPAE